MVRNLFSSSDLSSLCLTASLAVVALRTAAVKSNMGIGVRDIAAALRTALEGGYVGWEATERAFKGRTEVARDPRLG